jgi:hypothetical protein
VVKIDLHEGLDRDVKDLYHPPHREFIYDIIILGSRVDELRRCCAGDIRPTMYALV